MKRFLIFLGILFSSVFISSEVSALSNDNTINFSYYNEYDTTIYDYNWIENYIYKNHNLDISDFKYLLLSVQEIADNQFNIFVYFWDNDKLPKISSYDKNYNYLSFDDNTEIYFIRIALPYENFPNVISGFSGVKEKPENIAYGFQIPYDSSETGQTAYVRGFDYLIADDETIFYYSDDVYPKRLNITEDIEKIIVRFDISKELSNFNLNLSAKSVNGSVGQFGEPYLSKTFFDSDSNKKIDITPFSYLTRDSIISTLNTGILNEAFKDSIKNKKNAIYEKWKDFINNPSEDKWKKYGNTFYKSDLDVNHYDLMYKEYKNLINGNYCTNDNYYTDFNYTFLSDVNYSDLSVEINTSNYVGDLGLKIFSNLSYTIDYVYKDSSKNYLKIIDMSDYAALVLIPKVYNSDDSSSTSIMSDIYLKGTYDIELWKDIETKEQLYRYTNYNRNVFSHYFHREYKDEILYFIKKENNQSEKTITFDTRYYSYATKFTLTEEIEIVNPNTNETVTVPDISSLYEYEGGQEELNNSFNFFIKPIKFIFESITDFYNNYCPVVVQKFFFFVFIMTVCLCLIRIFL